MPLRANHGTSLESLKKKKTIYRKECRTSHDESLQMFSADKASFALRRRLRTTDAIMLQDYSRIQLVALPGEEGLYCPFLNGLPPICPIFDKSSKPFSPRPYMPQMT